MMKKKTLYVSDMDGTLLKADGELGTKTVEILNEGIDSGQLFTVASARNVNSIGPIMERVNLKLPVIGVNGACISDPRTRVHKTFNGIDCALIGEIWNCVCESGSIPAVAFNDGHRDRIYFPANRKEGLEVYHQDRIAQNDPRLVYEGVEVSETMERCQTITVVDTEEQTLTTLRALEAKPWAKDLILHRNRDPYYPQWFWLTIQGQASQKHLAVLQLAQELGVDEVVVFGDQTNDISMIEAAHRAYCPANALEEVKSRCTGVLGHHDTEAVAEFLAQEWGIR